MQWILPALRSAVLQGVLLSPRDEHKKALLKEASKHQVDASERPSTASELVWTGLFFVAVCADVRTLRGLSNHGY
eukprot:3925846-Pleurochrysis_carterae.AAC.1